MASLFIKYLYLLTLIAGSITARLITRQPTSPDKETVLPGRSGWERNDATGETDIKYGDDWLKGHMNHLSRNQAQYPSNRDFMGVTKDDTNRKSALHNVEPATRHRTLKYQQVRDEKLPNMLNNPNHDTQTTVEHREKAESDGKGRPSLDHTDGGERQRSGTNYVNENGLLGASKSAIEKGGGRRVGRLVPNPGWLPIDPNQRLGHEAPARLGSSQPKVDSTGDSPNEKDNKGKGKAGAKNKSSTTSRGGMANEAKSSDSQQPYQKSRTAGDKTLRTLQSTLEPTPPKSNAPKTPGRNKAQDPNQPKKSNLQDGTPFRTPGKVWRGNSDNSEVATHYGAPVQGINTETRMPPRPQNLKGYKEQLSKQEKHEATKEKAQTEASKAASKAGVLPASSKTAKTDKYEQNLAKFNTQHPVKANNIASGRPSEAPARMNPAAQGRPSVNEQRPVSPSGPWTPNRNARPGGASSPPLTPSRPGLAVRPRPNAGSGNTGPSQGISGPSTPPQISQGQRRNPPRKTDSRKKLRKRMIEQALVRDLDLRDFHFLL